MLSGVLKQVHSLFFNIIVFMSTVKLVLSGTSKIDKTKILMTNGSLMKFESIADSAILLTCIKQ